MTEEVTVRDVISDVFREEMDRVHTFFPGEIVTVRENGLVDVKPSVKIRFFGDDRDTDMPIINNCVLKNSRSKSSIIRHPNEKLKGSKVAVLISEHSLEDWREKSGDSVLPVEGRRFNINDAVAILGMYPETITWPIEQRENTFEMQVNEDVKIGIGNTAGDELLKIVYDYMTEVQLGVDPNTGTPIGIVNMQLLQQQLAKITNIT